MLIQIARHVGTGTTYDQEGAAGSCGNYNSDSSVIAALGNYWMQGEYKSPYCGRYIKATNIGSNDGVGGDGNVVDVLVQDTCESCGEGDVDFSLGAWNELTNYAEPGTFTVSWYVLLPSSWMSEELTRCRNFCPGTSPC